MIYFEVESASGGRRLDEYLFDKLRTLSKMYLRELVRTGRVQINGEFENIGYKLRPGDFIEIEADLTRGTAMQPENIPLEIIYEDRDIVAVNKPAGMLVHPTHRDKNGTLLNALTYYLNCDETDSARPYIRPGLVHRLDKETSGLMVIAKNAPAHRRLAADFLKKRVMKRYLALVDGAPKSSSGVICEPIGRFAELKLWGVQQDGKPSETRYRVIGSRSDKSLLELDPFTGRTNQLRIHCAAIGHPIVGDVQRGGSIHPRLCLHSWTLSFPHPITRHKLVVEAPVPPDFEAGP